MRSRTSLAAWFASVLFLASILVTCQSLMPRRSNKSVALKPTITSRLLLNQLKVRGGSDVDESDDGGEESEETAMSEGGDDSDASSLMSTVNSITKQFVVVLGKAMIAGTKASARAVKAAFQGDDEVEDEQEPPTFITKAVRTVKRMWVAAWDTSGDSQDESSGELAGTVLKKSKRKESQEETTSISDFGSYLHEAYGVDVDRGEDPTIVMGGTIGDALREAKSKARLLVVYIPSARPGKKKQTPDHEAIVSLLSPEVSEVAERRARKKQDSGSFVLWSAKASSPEAVTAIKRLKAKQSSSKGDKRPVLVVAYPAQVCLLVASLLTPMRSTHCCRFPPRLSIHAVFPN